MARYQYGRRIKPSGGFELFAWFFMRISGLVLVFLALGHLFITHILNNVEVINYAFVASRWSDPTSGWFWRLWDLAMINLAVLHGFNGLRQILWEYISSPGRRVVVSTLLWSLTIALISLGSYAIVMFQPDRSYLDRGKPEGSSIARLERRAEPAPPPAQPAQP